ncbi:tRNA nucleotidyltransferase [Azoarcus indigens]|uniref:tRNA nucleotidyltransferase (CCA-adding enzyme) n=1 Tax=Azoarcus indigens TaxID=29545 RepID=A0A4R6E234_9RHOO|nr:tRNA nucleotidyltransferase [Azoarcus indigens]NMG64767.1 tRNA nucleotidyltransferase [Azoarcus indigens]TDN50848.1 tRNA nucleotidyltransferase (CCA-adding enzyme) [Azoarcus indigens]
MCADFLRGLPEPPPADPGLNLMRLAALTAGDGAGMDGETLGLMRKAVADGALLTAGDVALWAEFERGLLAVAPSRMLRVLRDCGALAVFLPEVDALFGVPQSADDPAEVDIGEHLLRVVDEAARCGAPAALRFAALVFNVGKSDSPREHLPAHYRHMERGRPRIEAICERNRLPAEYRDLALLALAECERVHRAAEMRAGSIAALLERVDAFEREERFERLLCLCECDFRAFPGRASRRYPKAPMLRLALRACREVDAAAVFSGEGDPEEAAAALQQARAMAVAAALRSERWAPPAADGF